jgi:hypothetical protein
VVEKAVAEVHPARRLKPRVNERYGKTRLINQKQDDEMGAAYLDKIKVARYITDKLKPGLESLDLKEQIALLDLFIRAANNND